MSKLTRFLMGVSGAVVGVSGMVMLAPTVRAESLPMVDTPIVDGVPGFMITEIDLGQNELIARYRDPEMRQLTHLNIQTGADLSEEEITNLALGNPWYLQRVINVVMANNGLSLPVGGELRIPQGQTDAIMRESPVKVLNMVVMRTWFVGREMTTEKWRSKINFEKCHEALEHAGAFGPGGGAGAAGSGSAVCKVGWDETSGELVRDAASGEIVYFPYLDGVKLAFDEAGGSGDSGAETVVTTVVPAAEVVYVQQAGGEERLAGEWTTVAYGGYGDWGLGWGEAGSEGTEISETDVEAISEADAEAADGLSDREQKVSQVTEVPKLGSAECGTGVKWWMVVGLPFLWLVGVVMGWMLKWAVERDEQEA